MIEAVLQQPELDLGMERSIGVGGEGIQLHADLILIILLQICYIISNKGMNYD